MDTILSDAEAVASGVSKQLAENYESECQRSATSTAINEAMRRLIDQPAVTMADLRAKAGVYLLIDLHELGASMAADVLATAD